MPKVILITGASSGIGKSISQYLSKKDFIVYGGSRNILSSNISNLVNTVQIDITDEKSVQNAISEIVAKHGKIDILVNNAGKGITGSIEDTPISEMKSNFEVNFFGQINVIKQVLPIMRNQKTGLIINITSVAGDMGLPFRGIYSSSKSAFKMITESLSMEVQNFGIRVVDLSPGDIKTNIADHRYHTPVNENSAYKTIYKSNLDLMNEGVDKGLEPIKIAEKIHDIIKSNNPNRKYIVGGFMEKFSVFLKKILPNSIFEKLLMNHYKL